MIDERDTSFDSRSPDRSVASPCDQCSLFGGVPTRRIVGADRFGMRQRDGSRAERYAVTIRIAGCLHVAGVNTHAIRLTTLRPKREGGALEDLPGRT